MCVWGGGGGGEEGSGSAWGTGRMLSPRKEKGRTPKTKFIRTQEGDEQEPSQGPHFSLEWPGPGKGFTSLPHPGISGSEKSHLLTVTTNARRSKDTTH